MRRVALLLNSALLVLLVPFGVFYTLNLRHLDDLISKYECFYNSRGCQADFNGDGSLDQLVFDRSTVPALGYDFSVDITDKGRQLYRLPIRYTARVLRTHVGIRVVPGGRARLLVFDGVVNEVPRPTIKEVLEWDGRTMTEVEPTPLESDILKAMASNDSAGTLPRWKIFTMARDFAGLSIALVFCWILLWPRIKPFLLRLG